MPELLDNPTSAQPRRRKLIGSDVGAGLILAIAFLLRLWTAYGTFLNPDEALHYRVANKASLWIAYQFSLTTAHPPLLILFLYFWRKIGVSELWLRLPSIVAGSAFCWVFFRWLSTRFDRNTGWIGLIFASFLPPLVALSAEVRQYVFLLLFMAAATYLLEAAIDDDRVSSMLLCQLCIYLAMLTHYSALLFTAALANNRTSP
jgi:predicted membrane-bound mannosyltransferase